MIRSDSGLIFFSFPRRICYRTVCHRGGDQPRPSSPPPKLCRELQRHREAGGGGVGGQHGQCARNPECQPLYGFYCLKRRKWGVGGGGGGKGRLRNIEREARPRHCVRILYKMSQTLFLKYIFLVFFFRTSILLTQIISCSSFFFFLFHCMLGPGAYLPQAVFTGSPPPPKLLRNVNRAAGPHAVQRRSCVGSAPKHSERNCPGNATRCRVLRLQKQLCNYTALICPPG